MDVKAKPNQITKQPMLAELAFYLVVISIVFISTASDMTEQWLNSNTYSHGLFIVPMAAYLFYNRMTAKRAPIAEQKWAIVLLAGCSGTWFLANLMRVNLIEQLAFVSFVPLFAYIRFGPAFVKQYAAPILFLYFAIPFGDFLIPHLQEITADLSVFITRLFPIPVYRNGLYISIPNGDFLVAEACSGIRFLFTTAIIGTFYALMYIKDTKRQWLYIVIAIILPIVANGIRVFMIIAIAHYINLEAATGFDHLVYGWVFFTLVMLALLAIGEAISKRENAQQTTKTTTAKSCTTEVKQAPGAKFYSLILLSLLIGPALQMLYQNASEQSIENTKSSQLQTLSHSHLAPQFYQYDELETRKLSHDESWYKISYHSEHDEKELVNFRNRFYDIEHWNLLSSDKHQVGALPVGVLVVTNVQGNNRTILYSYKIGQQYAVSRLEVKFKQLMAKLTMQDFGGEVFIYISDDNTISLQQALNRFSAELNQQD